MQQNLSEATQVKNENEEDQTLEITQDDGETNTDNEDVSMRLATLEESIPLIPFVRTKHNIKGNNENQMGSGIN